ncbi:endo-beta-1,3-glucanase [Vararia minispora EC-137]|uniref:Endo-beta-1,3-glucanase n=1 Tax=Vararia minispora EC-137 TaxID=1314806 RepID=A0ACB8QXD5_9AGAM|nr:endo-beta-1,3-glucanase [Vararia minispora EC-137]
MLARYSLLSSSFFVTQALAGKRGLAWPYYNSPLDPNVLNTGDGQVVAIYDWETYFPPTSTGSIGNLGWIGMQGCIDCASSPVAELASRQAQYGWATVFSANEPDNPSSPAHMTPAQAATWYIQYINPLAIKKALPAVTSSTASGQGLDWLSQMVSACAGGCYYDYINLHWYGSSFSDFQTYVNSAHSRFPGQQIVISEFALTNPAGGASDHFFSQAFAWLDSQSFIELYFPFVATSPSLLAANDAGAVNYVGTGSCLYSDSGTASSVGNVLI